MLASIWLRLSGDQEAPLRALIEAQARDHGTMPFQPHLTVCSPPSENSWDAAADYVRRSALLPITAAKTRISYSTAAPMRAVVIEVADVPSLLTFREDLRRITGAPEPPPPHVSLLYSVDETGRQPGWSSDESILKRIAEECAGCLDATEFILDRPVIVAPDGHWTNIASWRVVRTL